MRRQERILAAVLCSAVGDAIGYRGGMWEFCFNGARIHEQVAREFRGVKGIRVNAGNFPLSDDTLMSMATSEALLAAFPHNSKATFDDPTFEADLNRLMVTMGDSYVESMRDMNGRAPGPTTIAACKQLEECVPWYRLPFDPKGGGCGGSMRAHPIGLQLFGETRRPWLVAVGIEAGRLTHTHPTGFLGSLAAAAFTAFAMEAVPPPLWGVKFLKEVMPLATTYLKSARDWELVQANMDPFTAKLEEYLKLRGIRTEGRTPTWPAAFGVQQRDAFYSSLSTNGWGGSSGDDSVIIAYDAVLGSHGSWPEFVERGVLHGGDNDSTGAIGGAFFGAAYGLSTVPQPHLHGLEYIHHLQALSERIAANVDKVHGQEAAPTKTADAPTVAHQHSSNSGGGNSCAQKRPTTSALGNQTPATAKGPKHAGAASPAAGRTPGRSKKSSRT